MNFKNNNNNNNYSFQIKTIFLLDIFISFNIICIIDIKDFFVCLLTHYYYYFRRYFQFFNGFFINNKYKKAHQS